MKRVLFSLLTLILVAAIAAPAFAGTLSPGKRAELEPEGTAARKLQRGFLNVALSPFEIGEELHQSKKRTEFPPSWFSGFFKGTFYAIERAVTGIYEMVTFPFAGPEGNYQPIIQPEFAWEYFDEESAKK